MNELYEFIAKNNISDSKRKILERLFKNNNNLLSRIDIDFVNSDYFERLDYYLLQAITSLDKSVQKKILSIENGKRELFLRMIETFAKKYYQFPYVNALIVNFTNGKFDELIDDVILNDYNEADLHSLNLVLTAKENELKLRTINDLRNIDGILEQKINLARNSNIDDYKNLLFIKKFNLSYSEIRLICQKYAYDLDHFHIKSPLIDVLNIFKKIVLSDNYQEIEKLVNSINIEKETYPDYQTLFQRLYEDEFNSILFNPKDMPYTLHDGCKLIDAGLQFNMLIRANGVFSDSNINMSPKEYWNNNIRDSLSFSTSLLSNNFLKNVSFFSNKGYIIGFSTIFRNTLGECSMGDNATMHKRKYTLDIRTYDDAKDIRPNMGDGGGQQFRPFAEMVKHGSGVYQEVTLERFRYYDDVEERVEPSYILFFKKEDDYVNDESFIESIKAAKSFNIPIVIIDLKKVLINEKNEIEKLLFDVLSVENIIEAIRRYANLIHSFSGKYFQGFVGNIFKTGNEYESLNNVLNNYLMFLDRKNLGKDFYQRLFDELLMLNAEKGLINNSTLFKLKLKYGLLEKYDYYNEKIYGITYKPPRKEEFPPGLYDYGKLSRAYSFILKKGFSLTDEVYNNKDIRIVLQKCEDNDIELTQEVLSMSNLEINEYIKKINAIRNLAVDVDISSIYPVFDMLSGEELVPIIQPIINKLIKDGNYYLLDTIKNIIDDKGLQSLFHIEYIKPQEDDFPTFEDWGDIFDSESEHSAENNRHQAR